MTVFVTARRYHQTQLLGVGLRMQLLFLGLDFALDEIEVAEVEV